MFFLFLIITGVLWIIGAPHLPHSSHRLARYLFAGLWYATFCLSASISYNAWFFSKIFQPEFYQFSESCKENSLLLYATVQVELIAIVYCLALIHKHFLDFYCRHIMYIDLFIMLLPWAIFILSIGVSVMKENFIQNLQNLNCTGQDIPEFNFVDNVGYIRSVAFIFVAAKLIFSVYLAFSGKLTKRYKFMSVIEKGLMGYFYTFILEILVSTHYQIFQSKSDFSVMDLLVPNLTLQPVQLLLYFPVVVAPLVIYKNMVDPVGYY